MLLIENLEIVNRSSTIGNGVAYLSLNMYIVIAKSMVITTYTKLLTIIHHHLVELEILQGSSVNLYWRRENFKPKKVYFYHRNMQFFGKDASD